ILVPSAPAQTTDLQQTVDQFYPERLKPANQDERQSCYEVLRTTPANEPAVIIAAYADRLNGAVRVLQRNASGSLEIAFDSGDRWMLPGTRSGCTIDLYDLDFDGQQEALVSFRAVRAAVGWIRAREPDAHGQEQRPRDVGAPRPGGLGSRPQRRAAGDRGA